MMSSPYGSVQVSWAPKADVYQSMSRPSSWKPTAIPRPTKSPGMIRLAIAK